MTMTVENLKSTAITNLDATPPTIASGGRGSASRLKSVNATILPVTGKTAPSTYQMVRIPSYAVVKHVLVQAAAATDFDADIALYFSDSTIDGTLPANQGAVIDSDYFATAYDFDAAIVNMTDVTYLTPTTGYLITDSNKPIWNGPNIVVALSTLTKDPGGFFDICLTTTVTNSVPLSIYLECQYI